jgi:hypothetical protein
MNQSISQQGYTSFIKRQGCESFRPGSVHFEYRESRPSVVDRARTVNSGSRSLGYGNLVYRPGRPFPFASAVRDNGSIALTPREGHSSMVRLPIVRLYLHPFFAAARSSSRCGSLGFSSVVGFTSETLFLLISGLIASIALLLVSLGLVPPLRPSRSF